MRLIVLLLFTAAPAWANPMVFEDFSDGSAGWRYFSDRVMGGISDGGASLEQEDATVFARLTGDVSTANNGGFVQIRRDLSAPFAADSTGLTLTVRGNGEDYFIHLRTIQTRRPWQYFQARFPTTSDWASVTLPWSAFRPSGGLTGTLAPSEIRSIGIVAFGRDHAADVSVAEIAVNHP